MKKIIIVLIILLGFGSISITSAAGTKPLVNCIGLPGCTDTDKVNPTNVGSKNLAVDISGKIISKGIQYTAVIAVIALMLSGIMYMVSGGEEEKVNKAKSWIIWSLVGVLLSISAWSIINILNNFKI